MMHKIDWDKYLSADRYRTSKRNTDNKETYDKRTSFESDFGRVAFSSALRRMHDKAQVVPLTSGDSVHTRLTHSIEVMSIAHSLGIALCRDEDFVNLYGSEKAMDYERNIPVILKTAAFIHDIGNPPFGHFGETIIQNYFAEYLKERDITDQQALDFTCFDGNAEGFRILTRLQYIGDLSGLNLTYATLATYTKYPNSGEINKKYIGTKKHGVFTSESDILSKMAKACNLNKEDGSIKRHPLSFLVEAADTISYSIMDVEDGLTMGWYSFSDIVEVVNKRMKEYTKNSNYSILETLKLPFTEKDKNYDEKRKMCYFRVAIISYWVNLAIRRFKENLEDIDNGNYTYELIEDDDFLSIALKDFAKLYIYPQRQIEQVELTGFSVLNGLLDILLKCAFSSDKNFRCRLKSILSNAFLRVAMHEGKDNLAPTEYKHYTREDILNLDLETLSSYSKLRLIVDLISGMTDKYAVNIYQQLSGQRL